MKCSLNISPQIWGPPPPRLKSLRGTNIHHKILLAAFGRARGTATKMKRALPLGCSDGTRRMIGCYLTVKWPFSYSYLLVYLSVIHFFICISTDIAIIIGIVSIIITVAVVAVIITIIIITFLVVASASPAKRINPFLSPFTFLMNIV